MNTLRTKENRGQQFKYELQSSPTVQRKFGGAVNRTIPKLSQSPIKELDNFMIDSEQKLHSNHREPQSRTRPQTYKNDDDYLSKDVVKDKRETAKTPHKQEIGKRRREFDMRVNNIEKMSEQIHGLFDYVKQSEDRVAVSSLLKNNVTKINVNQTKYANKLSQIRSVNAYNDKQQSQQSDYSVDNQQKIDYEEDNSLKLYKPKYSAKYSIDQVLTKEAYHPKNKQLTKSRVLSQRPATPSAINATKIYNQKLNQKHSQPQTPSKKKYDFEFQESDKNGLDIQSSKMNYQKLDYQNATEARKERHSNIQKNSDAKNQMYSEIVRIRSKIHSSEKRTLEMENKYLNPHLSANRQLLQKESHKYCDKNYKKKEHGQNNFGQKSARKPHYNYNDQVVRSQNINRASQNSDPVSEFKINVYPIPYEQKDYNFKNKIPLHGASIQSGIDYHPQITERSGLDSLDHERKSISEKIASILSQQVDIDKKLRNARGIFDQIKDQKKWNQLKKQLSSRNYSYTEQELERELSIKPNQFDPFLLEGNVSGDQIKELADCFIRSQKFWEQKVTGIVTRKEVENYKFNVDQIDLNGKGYINVEDLVCFINLQTNGFFRNRDVLTLYRRFMALSTERQGIEKRCFMSKIIR